MAENVTPPVQGEEESVRQGATSERLREKLGGCIRTGEITLSSGKVTDFYFDGRLVSLDPEGSDFQVVKFVAWSFCFEISA